jgi:hypothetical protein
MSVIGKAVLGLVLCLAATPAVAQIRVAVETGGASTASAAAVAAQLNDDTFFDFTATVVSAGQIDTIAELGAFDVVLLGDSGNNDSDWTAAMAAALRTWVEAGHGAVFTGWGNLFTNVGDPWNADLEAIFPTQNGPSTNEFTDITDEISFVNGPHPVTDALTDFAPTLSMTPGDPCCIEVNTLPAETGDTVLATGGGNPDFGIIVAVKNAVGSGAGRTAYLGPVYFGSAADYPDAVAALRAGQADRLLEQAVAWAAGVLGPRTRASAPIASQNGLAVLVLGLAMLGAMLLRSRA